MTVLPGREFTIWRVDRNLILIHTTSSFVMIQITADNQETDFTLLVLGFLGDLVWR
jgi:hypothetical protein